VTPSVILDRDIEARPQRLIGHGLVGHLLEASVKVTGADAVGFLHPVERHDLIIDLILAKVAEGLDDGAADAPGCGHVPRGGVLEDDFPLPDLHLAGRAVGQEDDAGGNLAGESEHNGGVSPGWLDADGVPGDKGTGDRIGGWGDRAEDRIVHGVVVEAAGKLAYGACGLEAAQAGVNRRRAAEIPEVLRCERPTPTASENPATDLRINSF
jgi:hypothetical protein